jgi:hypothetical protein
MDPSVESGARPVERPKARARRPAEQPDAPPPSHELIARRAYQLFEERGGGDGSDVEDWLRAERELLDPAREAGMLTREINEPAGN